MTKINRDKQRQRWSTPQVRRIDAGSADAVDNKGGPDGPSGGSQDKS